MKRTVAFDASPSVRSKDENGFLRVAVSHITKETVNPYYGKEIPNWQELNLKPNEIYYGYRSGEELRKAAHTFDGLPLLLGHHVESADDPQIEHRVGSLGTDARWNPPYLDNSLFVTDDRGIQAIENGEAKELSCAYMYDPVFRSGEFNGHKYDFIMTNIRGNHIALVEEGRAGPDVVVADAQITPKPFNEENSMNKELKTSPEEKLPGEDKTAKIISVLADVFGGLSDEQKAKLAQGLAGIAGGSDEELDTMGKRPEYESGDPKGFDEEPTDESDTPMSKPEEKSAKEEPMSPEESVADVAREEEPEEDPLLPDMEKAAEDAGLQCDEDFQNAFKAGMAYGRKPKGEENNFAQDEDLIDEPDDEMMGEEKEEGAPSLDEDLMEEEGEEEMGNIPAAMDAAIKRAKSEVFTHVRSLTRAANTCRSILGNIDPLAYDSASDIYGAALKKAGIDLRGHAKSSYRSMFAVMSKQPSASIAQDSAAVNTTSFSGVFSGLNRIK